MEFSSEGLEDEGRPYQVTLFSAPTLLNVVNEAVWSEN